MTESHEAGAQPQAADELDGIESLIVRNMYEGVCLVRADDGVIVYANPRFEQMFGYDSGELNGKPVSVVNYQDDIVSAREVARIIADELLKNGHAVYQVRNVKKDGTPFWCQARTATFEHPKFGTVWVAVQEDITERKRAEQALEEKVRQLEVMNRAMMDREQRIVELKEQLAKLKSPPPAAGPDRSRSPDSSTHA